MPVALQLCSSTHHHPSMGHGNGTPVAVPEPGRVQALRGVCDMARLSMPFTLYKPYCDSRADFSGTEGGRRVGVSTLFSARLGGEQFKWCSKQNKILYYFFYCVAVEEG